MLTMNFVKCQCMVSPFCRLLQKSRLLDYFHCFWPAIHDNYAKLIQFQYKVRIMGDYEDSGYRRGRVYWI